MPARRVSRHVSPVGEAKGQRTNEPPLRGFLITKGRLVIVPTPGRTHHALGCRLPGGLWYIAGPMYRTWVIIRHTFREAAVQPVFIVMLLLGSGVLALFGIMPFFTLGEDHKMFKMLGLNMVMIISLIITLFATSKSIFDEIEDRTMLTLMSKPIHKWEVLVGKYLGIVASTALAVAILGIVLGVTLWMRLPNDNSLSTTTLNDAVRAEVWNLRWMHMCGLAAALVLVWLQVSVLASIGVALSTRLPLLVNLPAVIVIYIAGNLTQLMFRDMESKSFAYKAIANVLAVVLPYLKLFNMDGTTALGTIGVGSYATDPSAVGPGELWLAVGASAAYAIAYAFTAMLAGMWLFQSRELGGAEG
jgi:hypothetical protein